jgi:hypothetical protein
MLGYFARVFSISMKETVVPQALLVLFESSPGSHNEIKYLRVFWKSQPDRLCLHCVYKPITGADLRRSAGVPM